MNYENPFPGMNPWLELSCGDVHARLVAYVLDLLDESLPLDLRARVEQREPTGEHRERYIEIVTVSSGAQVVTTIEFIRQANKVEGESRRLYQAMRQNTIDAGVTLVEIDLLRGGQVTTLAHEQMLLDRTRKTYHASVYQPAHSPRLKVYPVGLRERLPIVLVPLRPGESPIFVDLQSIINLVHRRGRYRQSDCRSELQPALDPEDAQWAQEILRAAQAGA